MTIRWWVRFAIRRNMSEDERRFFLASEREPFGSLIDVTDCCASSALSAEVWYEETPHSPTTAPRLYVGWIDELGRLHARRSNWELARKLALVVAADVGSDVDLEESPSCMDLWVRVPRPFDVGPDHHRFLVGEIRVGEVHVG